nr:hypothetical protein [Tanacetum cinerariifolium]
MLTKSMVAKLTAVSASECQFANFLSEIEPKKVAKALKHLGSLEDIPSLKCLKNKCFYSLEDKLEEKKGIKLKMPRNKAVHKELSDRLVKAATIASSLEADQDNDADKEMFDVDTLVGDEVFVTGQNKNFVKEVVNAAQVSTAATTVTITTEEITLAQELEALKTSKPKKRRHHFASKRAKEKRNKPPTKAQQRKIICTYLKNMEGYKLKDLKLKEFERIQELFDRAFKRVNTFEDFRTELVKGKEKRAGEELVQKITKKQKVKYDKEKAEVKQLMETIPDEEVDIDAIPLAIKSLRIWKIHKERKKEKPLSNREKNSAVFIARENQRLLLVVPAAQIYLGVVLSIRGRPREFWCTAQVEFTTPPKSSIIKFIVKNGKTLLTFNFETFVKANKLDYNNGAYIAQPQTDVIKVELLQLGLHSERNEFDESKKHKKPKKYRKSRKPDASPKPSDSESYLSNSLAFKDLNDFVPVTERVLAKNLQLKAKFLYMQLEMMDGMEEPNITMEEYIRLEEEKARKHVKVFNWETTKYGKIWYDEDVFDLKSVETKFPAIVFNDNLTSNETLSCEPTVSSLNNNKNDFRISFDEFDDEDYTGKLVSKNGYGVLDMGLSPRDQRHQYLRREVHRVQVFNFGGLPDLIAEGLSTRMLMEHSDAQGRSLFTSRAWRWLFDIRGSLVHELILEFLNTFRRCMSWREFILALGLHSAKEMQTTGFGLYWAESARRILDKEDLSAYLIEISSIGDFLGLDVLTRQILDLRGAIPSKIVADTKVVIQEMAKYSQKWHNGTSRTRSTETSDGLAAIQAQLNNLGREIIKVNKKFYVAQEGFEQCKGPRYNNDCPLKEERKTLEEAYSTQFDAPFQEGGYRAAALAFY